MRILLTNDDGIYSEGLKRLYSELAKISEVTIVAPESEQSAVGHAITLSDPLRVKEISNDDFRGFAVNGTPSDCVKIAISSLLKRRPDLVVSGINIGSNSATNILYSGTVSAATEGTILGIPSVAVSLDTYLKPDFSPAAFFMRNFIPDVFEKGLPAGTSLNVNVPALRIEEIKGVVLAKMGKARFKDRFHRRVDPRGHVYYWQGGEMMYEETEPGTDSEALRKGMITVTPIHYDLTDYKLLGQMETWNITDLKYLR